MINVSLGEIGVKIWALDEAEEKFIDNLEMRPGELQDRLVFLGVKCITGGVDRRGYRTEEVDSKHVDNLGVYVFSDDVPLSCDILEHFVQGLCLDLFTFKLGARVIKVE